MSEEKKYVTFRDLRAVVSVPNPVSEVSPSTSIPSIPSTSSTLDKSNTSNTLDLDTARTPSTSSNTSTTRIPSSTSTSRKIDTKTQQGGKLQNQKSSSVAPERDFQRIPNSVTRKAIPAGLFRGKSKQVWDYLWSVTRGAIVPARSTRKSRREIKAGSGLGSMVTVDAALEHLEMVGLIAVNPAVGSLSGNEYEVFTPEETSTSISSTPSTTRITQKVDELDVPESSSTSITYPIDNTDSWRPPNTLIKTKEINTDDEAFAEFVAVVKKTAKEITGRELSQAEAGRWGEVADVLMTELRIAAGRTTISSVPAFLAEHLRRRLWKKEKRQIDAEVAEQKRGTQMSKIDASKCPDCFGTGMYYPNGFDKGVARCPHSKITAESGG